MSLDLTVDDRCRRKQAVMDGLMYFRYRPAAEFNRARSYA